MLAMHEIAFTSTTHKHTHIRLELKQKLSFISLLGDHGPLCFAEVHGTVEIAPSTNYVDFVVEVVARVFRLATRRVFAL